MMQLTVKPTTMADGVFSPMGQQQWRDAYAVLDWRDRTWPGIKSILLQGHLNETIHPSSQLIFKQNGKYRPSYRLSNKIIQIRSHLRRECPVSGLTATFSLSLMSRCGHKYNE